MPTQRQQQGLERYIVEFNRLDQADHSALLDCLSDQIRFSDPFVELQGRLAMAEYLAHFGSQVELPRFEIKQRGWDGGVCLLRWDFSGKLRGHDWRFAGVSELHFDDAGRVCLHLDHWDSGRHFYRRLPLLGWLIRLVEARLQR